MEPLKLDPCLEFGEMQFRTQEQQLRFLANKRGGGGTRFHFFLSLVVLDPTLENGGREGNCGEVLMDRR